MPESSAHPSDWTLEQLAEGMLPEEEAAGATAHVEACDRCAAEMEAYRALYMALADLPRFEPSPGFGEAVMARIQLAPQPSPVWVWLQRWVPTTRRGWALLGAALVAPALPLIGLAIWLLSQPLVSPVAIGQWAALELQAAWQAGSAFLVRQALEVRAVDWAVAGYEAVSALPVETLGAVLATLAVAIPLSAWSLVRLVRTPMGNVTYAN